MSIKNIKHKLKTFTVKLSGLAIGKQSKVRKDFRKKRITRPSSWSLLLLTEKIVIWLISNFPRGELDDVQKTELIRVMRKFIRKLDVIYQNNGPIGTTKYIKSLRAEYLNYLSGSPRDPASRIKLTTDGIPVDFGDIIPMIRAADICENNVLPILSTILWSTRALKLGKQPNVNSITDPSMGSKYKGPSVVNQFWKDLLGKSEVPVLTEVPSQFLWKKFRLSTKAGPNGQALFTSLTDLYSLPKSLLESIEFLGGKDFREQFTYLLRPDFRSFITSELGIREGDNRKIVYFPDTELKVRVVAILDYFSQEVLLPVHNYLFSLLRRINQDCTFSQDSFINKSKDWEIYYSVDLTEATDRFPIQLICDVLRGSFSKDFVSHWKNIMVGYPYKITMPSGEILDLTYSVGNPMGAYSSWASFAISMHYLMYEVCYENKIKWKTAKYCILGDDVLIGDKVLAESFISRVTSLGVKISGPKTHISKHFSEFAKRLAYKGREITPFPISAYANTSKRYYLLVSLLMQEHRKGWIPKDGIPSAIDSFYTIVKPLRKKFRRNLVKYSLATELVTKVMGKQDTEEERLNTLTRFNQFSKSINPSWCEDISEIRLQSYIFEIYKHQFYRAAKNLFGAKYPLLEEYHESQIVSWFANQKQNSEFPRLFYKSAIPILAVKADVKDKQILQFAERLTLHPTTPEEWKLLKVVTIPLVNKVFTMSSKDLRVLAAALIGKQLISLVESKGLDFTFVELDSDESFRTNDILTPPPIGEAFVEEEKPLDLSYYQSLLDD